MSAISGVYTVKKAFKAGGKQYAPGDEYNFGGALREKKLITCGYVEFEPLHEDKSRTHNGRKGKVKNATN